MFFVCSTYTQQCANQVFTGLLLLFTSIIVCYNQIYFDEFNYADCSECPVMLRLAVR